MGFEGKAADLPAVLACYGCSMSPAGTKGWAGERAGHTEGELAIPAGSADVEVAAGWLAGVCWRRGEWMEVNSPAGSGAALEQG